MRHPSHAARLAPPALLLSGALLAAASCADAPTRTPDASAPTAPAPVVALAATDDERGGLRAALRFTREQSMQALKEQAAADRVAAALERLDDRLDANDRAGVLRAVAEARAAVRKYEKLLPGDDAGSRIELSAISLTLDRAESFTRDTTAAPVHPTTRDDGGRPMSEQRNQQNPSKQQWREPTVDDLPDVTQPSESAERIKGGRARAGGDDDDLEELEVQR